MSDSAINRILSKIPFPDPPIITGDVPKDLELIEIFKSNLDIYNGVLETLCSKVFSNALTNSKVLLEKQKSFKDIYMAVEKDISRLKSGFGVKFVELQLDCKRMPMRLSRDRVLNNMNLLSDSKISYIEDTKSICVLRLGQDKSTFAIPECPICDEDERINTKQELVSHIRRRHITFKSNKKKKNENFNFSFEKVELDANLEATTETMVQLNSAIDLICQEYIPDERRNTIKEDLIKFLHSRISQKIPNCDLQKYGSCHNGFETLNSDIDLCLLVDPKVAFKDKKFMNMLREEIGENKTMELCELIILSKVCDVLESANVEELEKIEGARVKIISFKTPTVPSYYVDICVNRRVVLENTRLIKTYAMIDQRVVRIGVVVKLWAKSQGIADPKNGTLSSYAYVLLVIYYFQHIENRVLPCLQEGQKNKKEVDNFDCSFNDNYKAFAEMQKSNTDQEAKLLLGFFRFYANYDWKKNNVDIRSSSFVQKPNKDLGLLISIQDPFENLRNLGDVVNHDAAEKIINCFKKTYMDLIRGMNLTLIIENNNAF